MPLLSITRESVSLVLMKPWVSVVIPTFNDKHYICQAIDSVLAQTYKNIEILVIDDGSSDGTEDMLKKYKNKIKYIYQENKGLSGARNAGLKMAQGKYISLLDADDIYHKERIKNQIKFLENDHDYALSYSDVRHFRDGENKLMRLKYQYYSGNIFEKLLKKNFIAPSSVLFKKEMINKIGYFDEDLKKSADWDHWLRMANAGYKFKYLSEALTYIRIRQSGNLGSRAFKLQHKIDLIRSLSKFSDTEKYIFYQAIGLIFAIGYPKSIKWLVNKYLFLKDKWRYQSQK